MLVLLHQQQQAIAFDVDRVTDLEKYKLIIFWKFIRTLAEWKTTSQGFFLLGFSPSKNFLRKFLLMTTTQQELSYRLKKGTDSACALFYRN